MGASAEADAMEIVTRLGNQIVKCGSQWMVPSQRTKKKVKICYAVDLAPLRCTCDEFERAADQGKTLLCKHIRAVWLKQRVERNELLPAPRNWPAYNKAKKDEKYRFQVLLKDLCRGIAPRIPSNKGGRPRLLMSDIVFAMVYKVYTKSAGRTFSFDPKISRELGLIEEVPSHNSIFAYMAESWMTGILTDLIQQSALPLVEAEVGGRLAIDSTNFSTSRFKRWSTTKKNKRHDHREWVRVHCACGVNTHVIMATKITVPNAHDAPWLKFLLSEALQIFDVKEVTADSAYPSEANFRAIHEAGAEAYIRFKSNATGGIGGFYRRAFDFYRYHQSEFLQRYHKRSQVEATYNMIKSRFGHSVSSRNERAMRNEVLCKILCHNICCVIQSIYELGIEPHFWQG